jgi:hypothetical protein
MPNKNWEAGSQIKHEYFLVYMYLLAGIGLLISTFVFLPRVAG